MRFRTSSEWVVALAACAGFLGSLGITVHRALAAPPNCTGLCNAAYMNDVTTNECGAAEQVPPGNVFICSGASSPNACMRQQTWYEGGCDPYNQEPTGNNCANQQMNITRTTYSGNCDLPPGFQGACSCDTQVLNQQPGQIPTCDTTACG